MSLAHDDHYSTATRIFIRVLTGVCACIGATEILLYFFDCFTSATVGGVVLCGILLSCYVNSLPQFKAPLGAAADLSLKSEAEAIAKLVACIEVLERAERGEGTGLVVPYLKWRYADSVRSESPTQSLDVIKLFISKKFKEVLLHSPKMMSVRLLYVGFLLHRAKNYILAWEVNRGSTGDLCTPIQQFQAHYYA